MLVRLRLAVPDRPGSLGLVASALGSGGADIQRVEVLESESGRAVDDVFVTVRDAAHLDRARDRVAAVAGVEVLGAQHPAPPTTGHAELELVDRLVSRPGVALQTLVDGVGLAVGADWAAALHYAGASGPESVVACSPRCPLPGSFAVTSPLRLAAVAVRRVGGAAYGGGALAPLPGTGTGLLVVREGGPAFHRCELWRLEQLAAVTGTLAGAAGAGAGAR